MAFELNAVEGAGSSAGTGAGAASPGAAAARASVPGARAYTVALALLGAAFTVYVTVMLASVLGLQPLATRPRALACLLAGLAVGAWVARPPWDPAVPPGPSRGMLAPLGAVAFVGASCVTLATWVLALWLPIGAYDALGYRLPAVAQWLDAGALVWVRGDDPLRNGYPLALEVIEATLFRASDSPAAADAVSHLFLIAGAAALAGYARGTGLSRALSLTAAALFLLVPMHVLNAPSGYADAAFAGALVAFFVALARWVDGQRWDARLAATLGMAAAFGVALKPHGFAFVGASLTVALGLRLRAVGVRRLVPELGTLFAFLAPASFFAVRNVIMTGNPIYPLELRVGDHVLLAGKSSLDAILTPDYNVPAQLLSLPAWLRPLVVWLQLHGPARVFDDRLAGLGYVFPLLGLPAMGWLALRVARTREQGLGVLLGATWLCFLLQPFSFWSRFTSWLWGAAALAIALLLQALADSGRERSALALASCAVLVALPEALYALVHVKRLDDFGLALLADDSLGALTRISGVDPAFVHDELLGRANLCRTAWRIGTDDANLDGIVAQLSPRPRLHVIDDARIANMLADTRAHDCERLIVIGDNPLRERLPAPLKARATRKTAFGDVLTISALPLEVNP